MREWFDFQQKGFPIRLLGQSKGVALLMVLWIVAILSVIVLEFSFGIRTETNIAYHFKENAALYSLSEGRVHRAIVELIYKHHPFIQQKQKAFLEEIRPEKEEWITDGRPYSIPYGQGSCEVRVMGEDGKIKINFVSETFLRKIVSEFELEGEARDVIVDFIMDWRDPDDFYRLNEAENDYYRSLPIPYDCKNENLDSIEELLLVRGVTREIFYGRRIHGNESIGLKDLFSVYASGEQIDINSASSLVMRMVLGISSETAQLILKAREEKRFENQQDLLRRVPEIAPLIGKIGRFILYQSRNPYYRVESRTRSSGRRHARGLKVIVKVGRREKRGYKIVQWVDDLF